MLILMETNMLKSLTIYDSKELYDNTKKKCYGTGFALHIFRRFIFTLVCLTSSRGGSSTQPHYSQYHLNVTKIIEHQ